MFGATPFWIFSVLMMTAKTKLTGDNVCRTEVTTPEIAIEWQVKNGTVRTYQWCWNVPPRCSVYRKQFLNETKQVVRNVSKLVEFCCEGYKEQNDTCVPECTAENCDTSHLNITECKHCTSESVFVATTGNHSQEFKAQISSTTEESRVIFLNPFDGDLENDRNKLENTRVDEEPVRESPVFYIRKNLVAPNQSEVDDAIIPILSSNIGLQNVVDRSNLTESSPPKLEVEEKLLGESLIPENDDVLSQEYTKAIEIFDFPSESKENNYFSVETGENRNQLLPNNHAYVFHGVIIALAGSAIIIILALAILTVKNIKDRKNKDNKKSVNHVAVYTTSIFHTPLPEPPTFDNPTYLTPNQPPDSSHLLGTLKTFEPRVVTDVDTNPHVAYLKKETRDYLYDHPPSTGSYRAASSVDGLSVIDGNSMKTQPEPLYDEIPSRDDKIEQESLYVNTLCRTKF